MTFSGVGRLWTGLALCCLLAPPARGEGEDWPAMEGTLLKYGPANAHVALLSGRHPRHLVLVGGLGDGYFFANYTQPLAEALDAAGWSLVQPLLRASHTGWGIGSLDQDAEDLRLLAQQLGDAYGSEGWILMGHSTGTQDAVRFVQRGYRQDLAAPPLLGVILQAPVSDREYRATLNSTAFWLEAALGMIDEGRGQEILYREEESDGTAVTAWRFGALAGRGGDDDMWSTDLTDAELEAILRPLSALPSLLILGGDDEYVVDQPAYQELGRRMGAVLGANATVATVEGGNHGLEGKERELVTLVLDFLAGLPQQA